MSELRFYTRHVQEPCYNIVRVALHGKFCPSPESSCIYIKINDTIGFVAP